MDAQMCRAEPLFVRELATILMRRVYEFAGYARAQSASSAKQAKMCAPWW